MPRRFNDHEMFNRCFRAYGITEPEELQPNERVKIALQHLLRVGKPKCKLTPTSSKKQKPVGKN